MVSDPLSIEENQVHIWYISLSDFSMISNNLIHILSLEEKTKASRFFKRVHQQHYRALHIALRLILARYLSIEPTAIKFFCNKYGKPYIKNFSNQLNLQFNLSDSGDMALCAIALDREVGVDIEYIRPSIDIMGISERFFSPFEYEQLSKLPVADQLVAFYRCWTRKEAYIKAIGMGLSFSLRDFDVNLNKKGWSCLLRVQQDLAPNWTLGSLQVSKDYAAALGIAGKVKMKHYIFKYLD